MEKLKTFQSGRKILSLCLSLCMILTVFSNIGLIASAESAYAPENFVSGSGTKDSPYEISTVGHLVKMVQDCGKNSSGKSLYYKLIADIDLNSYSNNSNSNNIVPSDNPEIDAVNPDEPAKTNSVENSTKPKADENEGFNWLYVIIIAVAVIVVGSGVLVVFLFKRKKKLK